MATTQAATNLIKAAVQSVPTLARLYSYCLDSLVHTPAQRRLSTVTVHRAWFDPFTAASAATHVAQADGEVMIMEDIFPSGSSTGTHVVSRSSSETGMRASTSLQIEALSLLHPSLCNNPTTNRAVRRIGQ